MSREIYGVTVGTTVSPEAMKRKIGLSEYAKKEWVEEEFQPKGEYLTEHQDLSDYAKRDEIPAKAEDIGAQPAGNYLTEVPSGYAKTSEIPTKTSQLQNDSGFLTNVPDGYAKTSDIPKKPEDIGAQPSGNYLTEVPSGYATEEFVTNKIAEAELGGEEVDLSGYAQKSEIPTKVSQLQNDKGYLTEHQSLTEYAKKTDIPTVPTKVSQFQNDAGYLTEHQSLAGYATEQFVKNGYQPKGNYLTEVPEGYAKTSDIPTKPEDINAQPAGNYALKTDIPNVPVQSVNGKTGAVSLSASDVGADKSGTASSTVSTHNTNTAAHNDIRLLITALAERLDALANSDDETLDQMAEVVSYIKDNRDLIEQVTTGKVSITDIVDNLTTNVNNKPLSAAQGVALKALIDAITIPTKLSQLTNDKGYITGYTETDPTVPAWAKAASKPTYTASEVGALPSTTKIPAKTSDLTNDSGFLTSYTETDPTVPSWAKATSKPSYTKSEVGLGNVDNVKQYSASNPPPYPVTSVNGKTGVVSII